MHSYLFPCDVYVQTAHSYGNRVGGVGGSGGGGGGRVGGCGWKDTQIKKREEKGNNNRKRRRKKKENRNFYTDTEKETNR